MSINTSSLFRVYGAVTSAFQTPIPKIIVKAFDRDLRSEEMLGEAVTDEVGRYEIRYSPQQFARAEKKNADLAVKVFSRNGKTLLYEPAIDTILFNAPEEARVDIIIMAPLKPEESEYETILRVISPLLQDIAIGHLDEHQPVRDITFLKKETGIEATKLEYLVIAHRLAEESKIDPAFFYALLRKNTLLDFGLSNAWTARLRIDINTETKPLLYDIACLDEKTIERDVEAAIREMIIPDGTAGELHSMINRLREFRDKGRQYMTAERHTRLVNLIGNFLSLDKIAQMGELFKASKSNLAGFIDALSGPEFFNSEADEQRAKTNLALANVLGLDSRIIKAVKESQGIEEPDQIKRLAALNRDDWKELLTKLDGKIDPGLNETLIDHHASSLVRKMEKLFPSVAFAAQMKREKKPGLKHPEQAVRLFTEHEDFDLQHTDIDRFFEEKNLNKAQDQPFKNELKSVQRIFKLIPHYRKTNALLAKKIHSAHNVVAIGQTRFVNEIAPAAGISKKEAEDVFARAVNASTASMLIVGEIQQTIRSMDIKSLNSPMSAEKFSAISKDFPNLKSLFQLTDMCACEHCRSVYSPAAYLVELLQFLDKRSVVDLTTVPPTTGRLAKDVLFERRPDLGDIDLGCENAETPLPYIDLVCELLEEAVSPTPGIAYVGAIAKGKLSGGLLSTLTAESILVTEKAVIFSPDVNGDFILRDEKAVCKIKNNGGNNWLVTVLRQTHAAAEELAAAPEYVNKEAYDQLGNSVYAFNLPFDLYHTEASAFFSRIGVLRSEVMTHFNVGGSPSEESIAAEILGLTEDDRKLIVTPDAGNQPLYWNTAPLSAVDEMKVVGRFLDKSGLTYEELEAFLELTFINPDDKLFIRHLNDSCDTYKKEIAQLSEEALDRMHRFLRFMKKTGWKPDVLNEVITQTGLGNGNLSASLILMTDLLKLKDQTGIKLEELVGFFGEIPHDQTEGSKTKALYQSIFLNKAVNGFIEEGLLPENVDGSKTLDDFKTAIAVCLRVSEQDFDKVTSKFADKSLTFKNLSLLYATTLLARRLKLGIDDYLILRDLTQLDVFSSPSITRGFVDFAIKARTSPLKIADVQFMLRHEANNLGERIIADEKVKGFLQGIQTAYQNAFNANRSSFDYSLKADELTGTLKALLSKLPGLDEPNVNNLLRMVGRSWTSPPDPAAGTFIDDKLGEFFDTTDIQARQNDLTAAAGPNVETERKALIETLLATVSNYFYEQQKQTALLAATVSVFRSEEDLVRAVFRHAVLKQPPPGVALLRDLLLSNSMIDAVNPLPVLPPINPLSFPDQYRAVRLLHKLLPLLAAFKLESQDLEWLLENSGSLGFLDLDSIPYDTPQNAVPYVNWQSFIEMLSLIGKWTPVANPADAENPVTLFSVMKMLLPGAAATRSQLLDAISALTGYDRSQLDQIDLFFKFSTPDLAAYRKPSTWETIDLCVDDLRRIGVSLDQLKEFMKPKLTDDDTATLRMALKARYDETLWLDTLKEIMDRVRAQKRDALIAYLLATNPDLKDENGLYDYFLIDVQMEACMPSSRIVQAHGTIQLFVQRCLMGLEPNCAADTDNDKSWDQWKWMKNYRVWEANRKIFLYPENWILPELLDDKSYLFSELENDLLQNEVTEDTTEDALIRYLEKLDEIAFLEVVAVFYQTDIYTMHVFARTKGGDPPIYYYRRFEKERYWSPWQKVDLDIAGDHLLAFVHNNRLYLAWPVFSEVPNPDQETVVPPVSGSSSTQKMDKPERKLKVQMAISEYANGKWKPKKVSKDAITTPDQYTSDEIPRDNFKFFYNEFGEQIVVFSTTYELVYYNEFDQKKVPVEKLAGAFDLTGCKGYPELALAKPFTLNFLPKFKDTDLLLQRYKELDADSTNDLAVRNALHFVDFLELLLQTPGTFRLTYPHQFTIIDILVILFEILLIRSVQSNDRKVGRLIIPMGTLLPYFFEDSVHAYAIIPGFYSQQKQEHSKTPILVRRTVSDVLKLIEDIVALYKKYAKMLKDDPNHDMDALLHELGKDPDFHAIIDELHVYPKLRYGEQFKNMYHPLLCFLRKILYKDGVATLMKRETQLFVNEAFNFNLNYQPNSSVIPTPYPIEDLDFSSDGSYSSYNWEMFYHVPLMLANRLSKDQKFEEALVWFHYMFNPTGALEGNPPEKYWVTKPFYQTHNGDYIAQRIDTLLRKISDPNSPEIKELEFAISEWRDKPFMPHVVARYRTVAYQQALFMNYVDHLCQWGDYLFRQDTMESITQATQMYILADKLLGPKPRRIPPAVKVPYETYNQLEAKLDEFGNTLIEFENLVPDMSVLPHGGAELPPSPVALSLYFCIPQNDNILEYWDRIENRLFNIRHCRNIDGVERSLALFAPPIDPGMLVRAAAAGLDISAVIAGLSAPLPNYRFSVLSQKASELVQEVRGLGSSLLMALEKKDAEAMALLRSDLEMKVLKAVREMKQSQIDEADQQIEILKKTKAVTQERNTYYAGIAKISPSEQLNLDKLSEAHDYQNDAQITQAVGAILGLIPDFTLGGHGAGGSPAVHATFGGTSLTHAANAAASVLTIFSGMASYEASRASILGGYDRRFDEWKLQERVSGKELTQIDQQIVAAQIRLEIAKKDLQNQDLQIENAQKTDEFMRSKFTNKQLYEWIIGEISSVYFQAYQLAYDVAKKAERCYQHELGTSDSFLEYGYWDSLKKGLQSADHLFHHLKRMEAAFLDRNRREYELTKHVSLSLLDPLALVRLRATGSCDFEIPEALFDMDHPGHYFRRIKSVSITLPCIAGPYTPASGKLSLVSNKYRKNTSKAQGAGTPTEEYEEATGNDERFTYNVGTIQSLATSSSQNDSGLFELNFRDERYLPFEGCGAIGSWRLELPNDIRQFDYNSISDVILHLKYTAREGGSTLRALAENTLKERLNLIKEQLGKTGLHIAFNMRHDMPNEWHVLKNTGSVTMQIAKTRLPYFAQALETELEKSTFIASVKNNPASFSIKINGASLSLNRKDEWKLCLNENSAVQLDTAFEISVTPQSQMDKVENLMILVKYAFVV